MHNHSFTERVWSALARIPDGRVTTYGAIATALGAPSAARAVARACANNPRPYVRVGKTLRLGAGIPLPCHRVVMSDGRIGGYSGPGGVRTKAALLAAEGIRVQRGRIGDLPTHLWKPSRPSDV